MTRTDKGGSTTELKGVGAILRSAALELHDVTETFPWGERAFKVNGKTFLFLRADDEVSFSVKLPRSAVQALALPFAAPTRYGLGKHGWITINSPKRTNALLRKQFVDWVLESYEANAQKPKKKTVRKI